jgi:hypothetical protein
MEYIKVQLVGERRGTRRFNGNAVVRGLFDECSIDRCMPRKRFSLFQT